MSARYAKYNIFENSGYTLIEILVGLTIIGLLFGLGYVNFRDFSRRQSISGAAKKIQGDLALTQQLALSGQKPDDAKCNSPNLLSSYDFSIVSSSNPAQYIIQANCSGGIVNNPYYKEVSLPADLSLSSDSLSTISFKVLGSGTNIEDGSRVTLTLSQTGTNNTVSIVVESGGNIQ